LILLNQVKLHPLTFKNIFKAGVCYYGITDLEALAQDTHKFESRYLDKLIGRYPEDRDLYYKRSPIHFIEQISCPIIFFQGLKDKVVPPSQAEAMVSELNKKDIYVEYYTFPDEQHGFRNSETLITCLKAEFLFYKKIFSICMST